MTWNQNGNGNGWGNAAPSQNAQPPQPQQPPQGGDPWANFESVEARAVRNPFLPAGIDAAATITELKVVNSQKNFGQKVFVAVLEVELEGERRAFDWVAKMSERPYLTAIKSLMCSINPEADPSDFGSQVMTHVTGPDQPLKGARVHVRTEMILTTKGNEFTKVYWSPAL